MQTGFLPIIESCAGCGACCRQTTLPPFVINRTRNEARERNVPRPLLDELLTLWSARLDLPESPCLWFDEESGLCRHYDLRPQACRDFERSSPSCHAVRTKFDLPSTIAPTESGNELDVDTSA